MQVPFVDLKAQFKSIKSEVMPSIEAVLDKCNFILGEEVDQFEKAFAEYCGAKYAVGVANGTEALRVAIGVAGIGEGDEIILPANTYIATALGAEYNGAKVTLVDIDPKTYLMDLDKLEAVITPKTKAILPVNLFGRQIDMDRILEIAKKHNLLVIEDSAQSHGAKYKGHTSGNSADLGCFSLYPGKNLGAYGDAGIVITNNEEYYNKLKAVRHLGQAKKNVHDVVGFNCRLDTIQAAVLNVKIKYISDWNNSRYNAAKKYSEAMSDIKDITLPEVPEAGSHIFHLFVIQTDKRDELQKFLGDNGIQSGIHYPTPIHLHGAFSHLGYKKGDLPVAEEFANRILSLPMFPEISDEQINYVASKVKEFFN